jgi:hypothetical protein
MEQQVQAMTRRALRERRTATPGRPRRRHRGTFRRRSYPLVTILVSLAVAASTYAYRTAMLADPNTTLDPRDVLHHTLLVSCLAIAVLAQGAQLRAAGRPGAAALIPWLVVALPTLVEAVSATRIALDGAVDTPTSMWLLESPYHGLVAGVALLAADGVRSTWTPFTVGFAGTALAGTGAAAVLDPGSVEALAGWETPLLRAVVVGMTICSALVASSHLSIGARWGRAMGCAVPAMMVALLPTVLTAPDALVPTQRWTIVVYPLGCLAAACLAVLLVGSGEVAERLRAQTATA